MDIEAIKKSIVVLVDKREKANMHITGRFQENNIRWMPTTLNFCDYTFKIPANEELGIKKDIDFQNIRALERKANLQEIIMNLGKCRNRFKNEFERSNDAGCKVHIVIEDAKAREKMVIRRREEKYKKLGQPFTQHIQQQQTTWNSAFTANSLIGSLGAFSERYNLKIDCISKTKVADYMLEVFYKAIEEYFAEVS